jgi:DNA repair protein RadC
MAHKKARLGDDIPEPEIPVGIPDRRPATTGKRSCEACTNVGPKATLQFCMRRTGRPPGKFVGSADDVCTLMRGLGEADRESFYALHLDARHKIIDIDKVAMGSMSGVEVHPREVFRSALLSGASSLVFVHNHPSGDPAPSRQDTELTTRLRQVGELCGIAVLDHVIVGGGGEAYACKSLATQGLLGEAHKIYPLLADKPPRKRG